MKNLSLLAVLLLTVLFSACKDDQFNVGNYSEGEPATLNMKITVPVDKKITPFSRSVDTDLESQITQMVIVGWEINSGRPLFIDLTGKLTSTSISEKAGREYVLSETITGVKSGRYRLYLIANWQSAYANLTVSDIEKMTEDQIKELTFTNDDERITIYGDHGLPMTQKLTQTGVDYYQIDAGDNTLQGVMLERTTAHIEFSITNAEGDVANNNVPNFEPEHYTVYRLPKGAKSYADAQPIQTTFFNSTTQPIVKQPGDDNSTAYTFDFFMLENNQTSTATGMTQWYDREAWDGNGGNDYANRKFTNAPEGSTFVVITGNYSGPALKTGNSYSSQQYFGPVSYIIHLGNFNTAKGGSLTNFSVGRNQHHIYNITVTGANSIIANVNVEDPNAVKNPAVEGYLSTQPIATVDAHYSKVMLKIPTASIFNKDDTDKKNFLILATPKNNFSQDAINVSDLSDENDYKWIQFQAPVDENTFPVYAGVDNHGDTGYGYINDLVTEMENYLSSGDAANLKHAKIVGDEFLVAAFIDENVYDDASDPAMLLWANNLTNNRIMQLNPMDRKVSTDEQSTVAATSAFNIQQKQIISPYSLNPSVASGAGITVYNPFGFEQVEESTNITNSGQPANRNKYYTLDLTKKFWNAALLWDADQTTDISTSAINNANARELTLYWFSQFESGVTDDATSFYKLTTQSGTNYSTYRFTPASDYYKVSQAIVSHNRDLNGDGKITSDEIRWYVPNLIQYYIYNFGYDRIHEDLRLAQYDEDHLAYKGTDYNYAGDRDYLFPRYFNSSRADRRLFWQDQRGATSPLAEWASQANNIRFVRNLGQFTDSYKEDFTRMAQRDADNRTIRIVNPAICRTQSETKAYPAAFALGYYNLLPEKFEYCSADSILTLYTQADNTTSGSNTYFWPNVNMPITNTDQANLDVLNARAVAKYNTLHSSNWTALPDGWRIPNQRELIAMFVTGVIDDEFSTSQLGTGWIHCCTFLNSTLWEDRVKTMIGISGGYVSFSEYYNRSAGYAILVRDIDLATGQPAATMSTIAKLRRKGIVRKH